MKTNLRAIVWAVIVSLIGEAAWAGGYETLAKKLSRDASKAGVERLAVLPLVAMDGSDTQEGRYIAEQLTTQMALYGKVKVVERSLMRAVASEQTLAQTGVIDSRSLGQLGRMLQAKAVVTGSYVGLGDYLEIQARIIDIETGVVLSARRLRVEREWFPSRTESAPVANGRMAASPVSFQAEDRRYGVEADKCAPARKKVDELEKGVLDLKARYWVSEFKKNGISADNLKMPGSIITDPKLRLRFYQLLKNAYAKSSPPLDEAEMKWLNAVERKAFVLYYACDLNEEAL
ncbi:MAG: hypothetical protein HY611_05110 [Elusimicrobia bacterium]|nr:hypothetical protein [Elusimicrobiota bacterium]